MIDNSADDASISWFSEETATFGDRMAAARDAAGMTQAALARRLGVKLKTIEAWENDMAEPRANKLQMLSGLLNVSLRWLMTGEGDGLEHPPADGVLAADAREILADLRQVRAEMTRLGDTLAGLEKRLRAVVKEGL